MDQEPVEKPQQTNVPNVEEPKAPATSQAGAFHTIKYVTSWVMVLSAILFAIIGIMAVWQVFGPDTGDVVGRAFASIAIVAFAALVVNVASRAASGK